MPFDEQKFAAVRRKAEQQGREKKRPDGFGAQSSAPIVSNDSFLFRILFSLSSSPYVLAQKTARYTFTVLESSSFQRSSTNGCRSIPSESVGDHRLAALFLFSRTTYVRGRSLISTVVARATKESGPRSLTTHDYSLPFLNSFPLRSLRREIANVYFYLIGII